MSGNGIGIPFEELFAEDDDARRCDDPEADDTPLDGHDLDGDAEAGEDDPLSRPTGEDEHRLTPFVKADGG